MKYNFYLILNFLINIHFSFPEKIKILILDKIAQKHFHFLEKNNKISYIHVRGEKINFFILLLSILYFAITKATLFQSYILAHIKFYNAEILISSQEVKNFFEIKMFNRKIQTIFVQLDTKSYKNLSALDNIKNKIDYVFCTGKYWADNYKKISNNYPYVFTKNLKKKYHLPYNKKKIKRDIIYISTYRPNLNKETQHKHNKYHYNIDNYLLKIINKFIFDKNIDLIVLPVYKPSSKLVNIHKLMQMEKEYYSQILPDVKIKFIYKNLDKFYAFKKNSLFVNIDSTLGYELILKGLKCVFFPIREGINAVKIPVFSNFSNSGIFWCKKKKKSTIEKIIEYHLVCNRKIINSIIQKQLDPFYTSKEHSLEKILKKILKKL
jgi:surface carbohydrate biosynthesis protein